MSKLTSRFNFQQAAERLGITTDDLRSLVVEMPRQLPAIYVTQVGYAEPYEYQLLKVDSMGRAFDMSVGGMDGAVHTGFLRIERVALEKFIFEKGLTIIPIGSEVEWRYVKHRELNAPEAPATDTAPPAHVVASDSNAPAPNFSTLATREQLIEAFGRFTGMDASWFNNIKDTPALQSARKITGQGGRGHIAEPWFCPFEVMQWVASPKRRKNASRKLSIEKAWELLEKNFPKVYSLHSGADPRPED